MRTKIKTGLLAATNAQRALSFMVGRPNEEFLAAEVQKATKLSKAGTYRALDDLLRKGLVRRQKKGRFAFFRILEDDCFVKQFKVLKTVSFLRPLIAKLKSSSRKVVLYGSASRGEDYPGSDIDLFVIAKQPQVAQRILSSWKHNRKLQTVVKTMADIDDMEERDPEFMGEINGGIVLWRQTGDS